MISANDLIYIGLLGKSHGLHGELLYSFSFDVFENEQIEFLVIMRDGIFVPFYIESIREKTSSTGFVKFDGVDNEQQARTFLGAEVFLPKELGIMNGKIEKPLDYFIGFHVITEQSNEKLIISDVDTSTANPLFVIESENGEIYIPINEDLIISIDYDARKITMQLPEGLLNL